MALEPAASILLFEAGFMVPVVPASTSRHPVELMKILKRSGLIRNFMIYPWR